MSINSSFIKPKLVFQLDNSFNNCCIFFCIPFFSCNKRKGKTHIYVNNENKIKIFNPKKNTSQEDEQTELRIEAAVKNYLKSYFNEADIDNLLSDFYKWHNFQPTYHFIQDLNEYFHEKALCSFIFQLTGFQQP